MNVEEDLTPEQVEGLSIHYVKSIEEAMRVSLPAVAESLAAKVFMETDATPKPKEPKPETPPIRTIQEPAVVHDKVVTWQS